MSDVDLERAPWEAMGILECTPQACGAPGEVAFWIQARSLGGTERIRVVASGRQAMVARCYLSAGRAVYVSGRLRAYAGDDGRAELEVLAETLLVLPSTP